MTYDIQDIIMIAAYNKEQLANNKQQQTNNSSSSPSFIILVKFTKLLYNNKYRDNTTPY